jgi:hypothetical protein
MIEIVIMLIVIMVIVMTLLINISSNSDFDLIFWIAIFKSYFVWFIYLFQFHLLIFNLLGIRLYSFSKLGA